ncbi:MAG TPA: DnaJ domain-containing protein [Armatimonadota bacterium]|jgi:curved DNA-binding protein CbpA
MSTTFQDHYDILGVPVDADQAAIRRAFRAKVRELHPDVAKDKAGSTEVFLRVKEAYAVLSDASSRSAFDVRRANFRGREKERASARPGPGPRPGARPGASQSKPGGDTWDRHQQSLSIPDLLQRALREIADGRFGHANRDLAQVLAREPMNPDALVLMGRLYQAEGRLPDWIRTLEDGVRANPSHVALRLALNQARKAQDDSSRYTMASEEDEESRRRGFLALGLMAAALSFLWGAVRKGPALGVVEWATTAPGPLILGGMLAAFFAGWTMAAVGYIAPVDDELFYPDTKGRSLSQKRSRNDAPIGLAVPMLALIHYSVAIGVMLALMLGRGMFSRSLTIVTALAFALALAMSMAHWEFVGQIMAWCPGWLMFAAFAGWFVGDLFRT